MIKCTRVKTDNIMLLWKSDFSQISYATEVNIKLSKYYSLILTGNVSKMHISIEIYRSSFIDGQNYAKTPLINVKYQTTNM